MKRPLFAVAVVFVIVAAVRLKWDIGIHRSAREQYAGIPAYSNIQLTGQVYQKDQKYLYLKSLYVSEENNKNIGWCKESAGEVRANKLRGRVRCEIPEGDSVLQSLPLGKELSVTGDFVPFRHATNEGEFDAAEYYLTLGLYGTLQEVQLYAVSRTHWPIRNGLLQMKVFLQQRVRDNIPEKYGGILEALLLGDRELLDPQVQQLYQRNGIFHILSISSLHITMIGMFLYHVLRKMGASIPVAGTAGCLLLLCYGTMTGFGVSAIRAIGMYSVKMLGQAVGRTYDMLTALGLLGGIMVTIQPYYLKSGGFLLSYTCVLGIGIMYPILSGATEAIFPGERGKAFVLSISIFLTTLPLQLSLFYEVSVYSVVLNLIIIPLMQPLMICGFLFLAFPGIGIFQYPIRWILEGYEWLCRLFEHLPGNRWCPGAPAMVYVVLYYLFLGVGLAALKCLPILRMEYGAEKWNSYKGKLLKWRWDKRWGAITLFLIFVMCTCLAVFCIGQGQGRTRNQVTFLDVGQGDCILVETAGGGHYLFDCGSSSRKKVGEYVLIPYLKYHGIKTLDGVFVSHPDADHTNGIEELLQLSEENGIVIRQLILPNVPAARKEFDRLDYGTTRYISRGDVWQDDGAVFSCLYPTKGLDTADSNAYSQCFLVNFRDGWSLLLMGDMEGEGEHMVAEGLSEQLQDYVVLKVAHHGSRGGTSMELLEEVRPDMAVISAGRNNRYGHPHKEVLERLDSLQSYVLSTAKEGQMLIKLSDDIFTYKTNKGGKWFEVE